MLSKDRLARERARRWWHTRRRIGSIERAAAFIDDVGFALLFPKPGLALPSLWEAASDRTIEDLARDWGPDIERVWWWKDELPARRLAWYGRFLHGRPSFLSREMLRLLYPRSGTPDDFRDADLSRDARRIAEILLTSGPTASGLVREAVGLGGKPGGARFTRALTELGRALVVTHAGTDDLGSGWPSSKLDLTARAFRLARRRTETRVAPAAETRVRRDARVPAARRYVATVVLARPADCARALGWTASQVRDAFEALVRLGDAIREGPAFIDPRARGYTGSAR